MAKKEINQIWLIIGIIMGTIIALYAIIFAVTLISEKTHLKKIDKITIPLIEEYCVELESLNKEFPLGDCSICEGEINKCKLTSNFSYFQSNKNKDASLCLVENFEDIRVVKNYEYEYVLTKIVKMNNGKNIELKFTFDKQFNLVDSKLIKPGCGIPEEIKEKIRPLIEEYCDNMPTEEDFPSSADCPICYGGADCELVNESYFNTHHREMCFLKETEEGYLLKKNLEARWGGYATKRGFLEMEFVLDKNFNIISSGFEEARCI